MSTGNNNYYVREWFEVNLNNIGFSLSRQEAKDSQKKWFPYDNAGGTRKWYGFLMEIVNWAYDGEELQTKLDPTGKRIWAHNFNLDKIFKKHIGWSDITSDINTFRFYDKGFLFSSSTNAAFEVRENYLSIVLGLCNSKLAVKFKNIFNPTMHFTPGNLLNLPFSLNKVSQHCIEIKDIVDQNVFIAKTDWDAHETSWDFEANPLVALRNEKVAQGNLESSFRLSDFVEEFETQWTERFMQLHQNEEDLNRQFISIYGLEDELTPDVPLDEITILQQGEISIVNNGLEWHEDVLMKQLISYAVGVWMGRYKLGQKGLHIAHPNPTEKELQEYWYGGVQVYIDEDGLIPVLPQSSPFDDNLSSRISDFIRITFGEDKLTENLNYIEQKLGTSIDQYVQKDFWKDHKKMYQNRPIYWLFSSSKGAFKCLAYMHRMNAYTAERVRSNYLLPYIEFLQNQIGELENRRATLSTAENRKLQNFQKALDECREYHERLQVVAEQAIAFDLDDGVVVNYAKFGDVLAKIK